MILTTHDLAVALLGLVASVVGGALLAMMRQLVKAQRATNAHVVANTDAKTASVLDVASLQAWARGVDVTLAELGDRSPDLAHRLRTDGRLRDLEAFQAEWEGIIGRVGTAGVQS